MLNILATKCCCFYLQCFHLKIYWLKVSFIPGSTNLTQKKPIDGAIVRHVHLRWRWSDFRARLQCLRALKHLTSDGHRQGLKSKISGTKAFCSGSFASPVKADANTESHSTPQPTCLPQASFSSMVHTTTKMRDHRSFICSGIWECLLHTGLIWTGLK